MIGRDYCLQMCRYNRWMNGKVIDSSAKLSNDLLNLDQGAFFASIMHTLNHLYIVDQLWLARFSGAVEPESKIDDLVYSDIEILRQPRIELDAEAEDFFSQCSNDWFEGELEFTSQADGLLYVVPKALAVMHLFNHQVHHRGQVSTMLYQQGMDIGVTDLPRMPL